MLTKKQEKKSMILNFGPQHPAAHGVLRLLLKLNGEKIETADPHIGLLHRGTEKLLEYKNIMQGEPYFDRLDYVSMMAQEHTYALVIEHLLNWQISEETSLIRILFLEITRLLNHLLSLTTHALDVGALTPFLWGFEQREKLMFFYEKVSGARLHANYIRPGNKLKKLPESLLKEIFIFCNEFKFFLTELEEILFKNRIWTIRLMGIGELSLVDSLNWGCSGPLIRGSGLAWDLRKTTPYELYSKFKFSIPVGNYGDSYDRFFIRIEEMKESIKIMEQCIFFLNDIQDTDVIFENQRNELKFSMEGLIEHFKLYSKGIILPKSSVYIGTEAPKGEFGIFMQTLNSALIYRCKIRAPGFAHLSALNFLSKDLYLADIVTLIGNLDIVFGEIDR